MGMAAVFIVEDGPSVGTSLPPPPTDFPRSISLDVLKTEHLDLTQDGVLDPEVQAVHIFRYKPTEQQKVVNKFTELWHGSHSAIIFAAPNAESSGKPPEVAPPLGEHARSHGVLRPEEGKHVVEHLVRERSDAVDAVRRRTACGVVHFLERILSNRLRASRRRSPSAGQETLRG
ncbi:hypothetical protein HU200_029319 [Digitaria exilis]|uniref:Uncharacterized protein n=1 Tax=Digitaria exilis TaxID=1010633 RepID=A0A835EV26_9POAL|nr:hypothetical protein HU200_029319 [Digitaria exilis]